MSPPSELPARAVAPRATTPPDAVTPLGVYGVCASDVSAELPGLFPDGFEVGTLPTLKDVQRFIGTADSYAALVVKTATGAPADGSGDLAPVAREFITMWATAKVLRIVYAGMDPIRLGQILDPYTSSAASMLDLLGAPLPSVAGGDRVSVGGQCASARELLVTDADLDAARFHWKHYFDDGQDVRFP